MISNISSNIETTFTLSSLSFHRGKLQFEVSCNHLIVWSYRGFIKSNCDDNMMSMVKNDGIPHALFASKIFSLPIPTRPGTRTFLQVPDPSHPEVKNPYPSDPAHKLFQVWANKLAAPLPSEAENGFSWICILWDLIKRVSKKMAQSNISTRFIFFMQKRKTWKYCTALIYEGIKVDQPHTVQLCVYDVGGRVKGFLLGSAILFAPFQTAFS